MITIASVSGIIHDVDVVCMCVATLLGKVGHVHHLPMNYVTLVISPSVIQYIYIERETHVSFCAYFSSHEIGDIYTLYSTTTQRDDLVTTR